VATLTVLVLCGSGLATIRYAAAWRDPVTLFGWGTRSQPASSKVHQLLGASLLEEEPLQAAESFSRSLEIWPENYKSLYGLYKSYAAMGSDDLAKSTLARARPIRRATADENYTIGQMLRDAGELAEAESRWAATVEVEPRHSGAWADLGTLALMRRDTAEARTRLERAVELDPTMASAWYNLGILYRDLGAAEASQEALREFLATAGPDYDDAGWQTRQSSPGGRSCPDMPAIVPRPSVMGSDSAPPESWHDRHSNSVSNALTSEAATAPPCILWHALQSTVSCVPNS
jgi:tetratricopeptide (TPR) repeat protein